MFSPFPHHLSLAKGQFASGELGQVVGFRQSKSIQQVGTTCCDFDAS